MNTHHDTNAANRPPLFRWAGHSHVFRTGASGRSIPEWAGEMRERFALNYFGFGHPWEAEDLALIRTAETDPETPETRRVWELPIDSTLNPARFERWKRECSRTDFLCGIDLESPKVRYGHLWWLDWQPLGAPWEDYDQPWGRWEGGGRKGAPPPFDRRMPTEAIRSQTQCGALGVYAHPTSWWTGAEGQFVTNIAATLVPDLLSGQFHGAMVVMGYDARQDFYRALWFDLLNRGWFVPGVAETDACLDDGCLLRDGLLHNVCRLEQPWTLEKLKDAVRMGSGCMTSGPIIEIRSGDTGSGGRIDTVPTRVSATAWNLRPGIEYTLELVGNGRSIAQKRTLVLDSSQVVELAADLATGGWILATLDGPDPKREAAITNPILVGPRVRRANDRPFPAALWRYWTDPRAGELLDYLIHGRFRGDFPGLQPGEVPPEAFRWADWENLLQKLMD